MCAEESTILRAVVADSSLTVGIWRSLRITIFSTYQGVSTIMRNAFDWKRSRIYTFFFSQFQFFFQNQGTAWTSGKIEFGRRKHAKNVKYLEIYP
jgi:hypothetical protein